MSRTVRGSGWLVAFVVVACNPASVSPTQTPTPPPASASAPTAAPTSAAATLNVVSSPQVMPQEGTFEGQLGDASQSYQVRIWIDGCPHTNEVCGDIEYTDPKHPESVLCAPQLVFQGIEGDRDVFLEHPAYRPGECQPTTLKIGRGSDAATIDIAGYGDPDAAPCCHGTATKTSDLVPPEEPPPAMPPIAGFDGPIHAIDLIYTTTQYSAGDGTFAYFPNLGMVTGIDAETGETTDIGGNHDVKEADPQAVTLVGGRDLWAARTPSSTVAQLGTPTSAVGRQPIQLEHPPYALAADGTTLWVTSFDDSAVMRVDTTTSKVVATINVTHPTGVALGGGWVWVVEHRDDKLARIDPATNKLVDEIALGDRGDDDVCGMCVENVVYAFGSAWTADDFGRSISRVDGKAFAVTTIPTPLRVWSVTANDTEVFGSQMEGDGDWTDPTQGGFVRIDPKTNKPRSVSAPGTLGVAALGKDLWLIVPARRSDFVMSYRPTGD